MDNFGQIDNKTITAEKQERLKISQVVVVEGKYDKISLENIIDAYIIETNGFGIVKNTQMQNLLKKLAAEVGVVILTDSDRAGFFIRNTVAKDLPKDKVINVYIPEIYGKEKRKATGSKEGKLGVEGMSREAILSALKRAGVCRGDKKEPYLTKADLYTDGLSGRPDSKRLREDFFSHHELPRGITTNSLLSFINAAISRQEYEETIKKIKKNLENS